MNALMIDNGESTGLAELLGRSIDVAYYSSWVKSYPLSRLVYPGVGLDGVTRINDPISYLQETPPDLVIIPDLYQNDLERLARKLGIPCFGPGEGTRLETDRWFLKEFLIENDLPIIPAIQLKGIDALEACLRNPKHEDKWIKVSVFRGDMNTYHHKNWRFSSNWFADLARRLGPIGRDILFIVEDALDDAVELSIEGIWVDGVLLEPFMVGMEIKDAGEFGFFCGHARNLPNQIQDILDIVAGYFAETEYRGFFALEMRMLKDGTAFLNDVAARIPTPPGSVLTASIQNLPEVMAAAGAGEIVTPNIGDAKYLTEIIMKSKVVVRDFLPVFCPEELRESIALFSHCIIDGDYWAIPHTPEDDEMETFGSVFCSGETPEQCEEGCNSIIEQVEAQGMFYKSNVLTEAQNQMAKVAELGIEP